MTSRTCIEVPSASSKIMKCPGSECMCERGGLSRAAHGPTDPVSLLWAQLGTVESTVYRLPDDDDDDADADVDTVHLTLHDRPCTFEPIITVHQF
ncbi:hypothetical protein Tco_0157431 [Tanacetum coccineum]